MLLRERITLKKLIIKTAAITFAAIIAFGAFLFGGLALFAPATLARLSENFGNDSAAAGFYINQYNKTGAREDLYNVCRTINEHDRPRDAAFYFEKYFEDGAPEEENKKSFAGRYVVALFICEGVDEAADKASDFAVKNYTEYDAFNWLLTDRRVTFVKSDLERIKSAITSVGVYGAEKKYADADIKTADELIAALGN